MNYPAIPREFFNGDCFDAYRILGAHPCTAPDGAEGWRFAVWAPGATAVEVCGGFDGWEAGVPMERAETGVWSAFIPGLAEGDLYKYRVHGADGSVVMRSDPYAFSTELRPGTASRLPGKATTAPQNPLSAPLLPMHRTRICCCPSMVIQHPKAPAQPGLNVIRLFRDEHTIRRAIILQSSLPGLCRRQGPACGDAGESDISITKGK